MRLSYKHLLFGAFVGFGLLFGVIKFLPDNKLHVFFCDVGQGDATYIRLPNGADMLIDGGPNSKVLSCLGNHMPFYDRDLDLVVLTHPQTDHMNGLLDVASRYHIKYFATAFPDNPVAKYQQLLTKLKQNGTQIKTVTKGKTITFDQASISELWPDENYEKIENLVMQANSKSDILGSASDFDTNLWSSYLDLKYGNFQALFTGDGDIEVQNRLSDGDLNQIGRIQVLKVPHHGSKTSLNDSFLNIIQPELSVIEVGKNSYGHPNQNTINQLLKWGKVERTDKKGDIEIISDGNNWYQN